MFCPLYFPPFLSTAHEVGAGDIVIAMSGRVFPDDILETDSRIVSILHTHIP